MLPREHLEMSGDILVVTTGGRGDQWYPTVSSSRGQGCCLTSYSVQTAPHTHTPLPPAKTCLASNVNNAKVEKPSFSRLSINHATAMLTSYSDEPLFIEKERLRVWDSRYHAILLTEWFDLGEDSPEKPKTFTFILTTFWGPTRI